jgi:nitrite reductase/ring-hydroxylating ferredoxin subunit
MTLIKICKAGDVPEGSCLRAEVEGLPALAVFKFEQKYFVINDRTKAEHTPYLTEWRLA